MASYKIKFLTIILSVQTFLSITTAFQTGISDTDAIAKCKKEMHDNCTPNKSPKIKPSALDCVKRAIGYWTFNEFQKGDVYTYYETFHNQLQLANSFQTPQQFCNGLDLWTNISCSQHLSKFGDSKETALSWALLNTKFEDSSYNNKIIINNVPINYGHLYLVEIEKQVSIKPGAIKEPSQFCIDIHTQYANIN